MRQFSPRYFCVIVHVGSRFFCVTPCAWFEGVRPARAEYSNPRGMHFSHASLVWPPAVANKVDRIMKYPHEFSAEARARIEAERIKARRDLKDDQQKQPPSDWTMPLWDQFAFTLYIL